MSELVPASLSVLVRQQEKPNGLATASMVLGICQVVPIAGFACMILAIVFGAVAMRRTGRDPELGGRGKAIAGLTLGLVGLGAVLLIVTLAVIGASGQPQS